MTKKKQKYPVITLSDVVLYPNNTISLFIGRDESLKVVEMIQAGDAEQVLFVPQLHEDYAFDDFLPIATLGKINQINKLSDGRAKIIAEGLNRFTVKKYSLADEMVWGEGQVWTNEGEGEDESTKNIILSSSIQLLYLEYDRQLEDGLKDLFDDLDKRPLAQVIDVVATVIDVDYDFRLNLLAEPEVEKRFEMLASWLEQERIKIKTNRKIQQRVRQQMDKNQHEYYLNEQIKAIQKELNELNDDNDEIENYRKRIEKAQMSAEAEKKAFNELSKLKLMPPQSSEATVSRIYLDWLCDYPWAKSLPLKTDLKDAEEILNADHYGLEEVKERILEYLAVQKRNPEGKAPIICFVGPPGVGKTSLGKSIARATGRDFERIALGGMHDEAEIRGHRRTYIGAQPGKIVQKLTKLASNNPVILLDEIDKIGHDFRGDPADALLEVLDPAQNHTFNDHFLETQVDLSKVLFIATANTLNIPSALLDRMEVIQISGYTSREKEEIAKRYIFPKQLKDHALKKNELKLNDEVIPFIIENYTREAGVRNLERELNKLARKAVRKLEEKVKKIEIQPNNLVDYLGVAKYQRQEDDLKPKIGVINGLAWTSVGGELLQIEALQFNGKGKLNYTGQLGDVMKESVQTAFSVVRAHLSRTESAFDVEKLDLHLHLPEGAVPKDGPSAGIAMATVMLSAMKQIPIRGDIAMTGEISLQGRVLPIGGLKEKLLAAVRANIKTVLIPKDNLKDLHKLPEEIGQKLEIIGVQEIGEVFKHALLPEISNHLPLKNQKKTRKNQNSTV